MPFQFNFVKESEIFRRIRRSSGSMAEDVIVDGSSRRNQESVASSDFQNLTDELLIETLIRLPVKEAILCKCVSRRLHSLVSSSHFVRTYMNYHERTKSFALYYQAKPVLYKMIRPHIHIAFGLPIFESSDFSLSFLDYSDQDTLRYLTSDNGLVLCCVTLRNPIVYIVCNPLTKQWITLPPPPSNVDTVYVGFICNPHEDERKTTFTVVRIEVVNYKLPSQLSATLKLEIYSSVSGRWSEKCFMSSSNNDRGLFYGWKSRCPSAVVCHGLLHWDILSNGDIFMCDPRNSKCSTIDLPLEARNPVGAFKNGLGVSCGRLRHANFSWYDTNYRVWELTDYANGGEWLLLHKVHLDEIKSSVPMFKRDYMCLISHHPLNQDIIFLWCRSSRRIMEYNMVNKCLQLPCFLRDVKMITLSRPMFFPFVLPSWPTTVPRLVNST